MLASVARTMRDGPHAGGVGPEAAAHTKLTKLKLGIPVLVTISSRELASCRIRRSPRHAYTRALLACRPAPGTRPRRLPVIDDFLNKNEIVLEERQRGLTGSEPIILEARRPREELLPARRPVPQARDQGGEGGLVSSSRAARPSGLVGEIGLRQDHRRGCLLTRLHSGDTRPRCCSRGEDLLRLTPKTAMKFNPP